jgi:hypothetical protein
MTPLWTKGTSCSPRRLKPTLAALVTDGYLESADARAVATRYRQHSSHARVPIWWPVG